MRLSVQVRVGVCEWLAWLLRMHREPEVDLVTSRRSSYIQRQSTGDEDVSNYSLHGHRANVCGTNDNGSGDYWLPRRRSTSLCRQGSTRSALRRNTSSRVEHDGDTPQWRRLQTTAADLVPDDRSRSNTLLWSILHELRQLTGKVYRDEAKQDKVNDWRFAAMVVDRLCLCAFTIFTVVSTSTILLSAPSFHAR